MVRSDAGLGRLRERFDAVLVDVDGTLLDPESRLRPRTRAAVQRLHEAGLEVILCTGRSPYSTHKIQQRLGLAGDIVAYNGSWIGPAGGEPEHLLTIPDEVVGDLLRMEAPAAFSFRHTAEGKWTRPAVHAEHVQVVGWFERVQVRAHPEPLPDRDLMRVSLFFEAPDDADASHHDEHWAALLEGTRSRLLRESFPLNLFSDYRTSRLEIVEIQGHSRGKAEAYDWLQATRGIPAARTIAIGDQQNDVTMHQGAGLAVAMGNAIPALKAAADLVIGSHADDGLAAWIEAGAPFGAAAEASGVAAAPVPDAGSDGAAG